MLEGLLRPQHLLIILALVVLIYGPKRLPEMGAGIGKSIKEFKKAISGEKDKERIPEDTKKS